MTKQYLIATLRIRLLKIERLQKKKSRGSKMKKRNQYVMAPSGKQPTKFKKLRGIATAKMSTDEIMSLTRSPEIRHDSQPITRILT
ncbi:MAG: hypothetical protein D3917_14725 [Candidatus Electrothrix sp. AX5]|nr:hypothetical protein [Candidatus Electrothrix sp. AX5]